MQGWIQILKVKLKTMIVEIFFQIWNWKIFDDKSFKNFLTKKQVGVTRDHLRTLASGYIGLVVPQHSA